MHLSNIFCAIIFRWDNGETEKLSPWDVEPIGDDGESLQHMLHLKKNISHFFRPIKNVHMCRDTDPQPEMEGGGIPVTPEEMSELMYKPLTGEWGERSRDEECDRIIAGIEQLITVGASTETKPSLFFCKLS